MDLRNRRITVGEILANPNARAILSREYPTLLRNPMIGRMRGITLGEVLQYAGRMIPPQKIQALLRELEAC